jgi:putative heme-binding domain-containing protein
MTNEPDIAVRLQLAFSLGSLPFGDRIPAVNKLVAGDIADPRFRLALQSSLEEGAAEVAANILEQHGLRETSDAHEFLAALANQIGRSKREADVRMLVQSIDGLGGEDQADSLAKDLVVAMLAEGSGIAADNLAAHSAGRVKTILATLLTDARATALNADAEPEARRQAITVLGCGSFVSQRETFDELLQPQQPQPVQEAVVQVLGRFSDAGVAELLLTKWPSFTPGMRSSAAEILLSRPAWAEALLSAVESKQVSPGDFDPARIALLKAHPTQQVRERATAVFAGTGVARRADVVANYREALKLTGDAQHGRAAFQKTCATCHVLEGAGAAVGAELGSVRDQGREAIMLNILDPNREINPKFLTYAITTNEGRVITGMITEETPNNITIRQADGAAVPISRVDIDEMESTGMSYMPEGLESQLDHQAMADLLSYIMSIGAGQGGDGKEK